jgi:hypothetical protein
VNHHEPTDSGTRSTPTGTARQERREATQTVATAPDVGEYTRIYDANFDLPAWQ